MSYQTIEGILPIGLVCVCDQDVINEAAVLESNKNVKAQGGSVRNTVEVYMSNKTWIVIRGRIFPKRPTWSQKNAPCVSVSVPVFKG
jgi:hypothetical protein